AQNAQNFIIADSREVFLVSSRTFSLPNVFDSKHHVLAVALLKHMKNKRINKCKRKKNFEEKCPPLINCLKQFKAIVSHLGFFKRAIVPLNYRYGFFLQTLAKKMYD
ncbi:MAG: hypothetical protein AAGK05_16370, partial [Pseudomonadota bacterium]